MRTADTILNNLKVKVQSGELLDKKWWLQAAFDLIILRIDEARECNRLKRDVAAAKLEIIKKQDKKNVAAAEIEVEATEKFVEMKNQEDKIYSLDELVRVAKASADEF